MLIFHSPARLEKTGEAPSVGAEGAFRQGLSALGFSVWKWGVVLLDRDQALQLLEFLFADSLNSHQIGS
jgi:hypothetical protein